MPDETASLLRWLVAGIAVVGVAWAAAWGNVNTPYAPVPSPEQACAASRTNTDFCAGLLKKKD